MRRARDGRAPLAPTRVPGAGGALAWRGLAPRARVTRALCGRVALALAVCGPGCGAPEPPPPPAPARTPIAEMTPTREPYSRPFREYATGLLRFVERDEREVTLEVVFPPQALVGVEAPTDLGPMTVRTVYHEGTWTLHAGGRGLPLKALDEAFRFEPFCQQGQTLWFRPVSRLRVGAGALPWPEAPPGGWVGFVVAEPPAGPALAQADLVAAGALLDASTDLDPAPELALGPPAAPGGCAPELRGPNGAWSMGCCEPLPVPGVPPALAP